MLSINQSLCKCCGTCIEICPNYVFGEEDSKIFVRYPDHCYECGHCVAYCPADAIIHNSYDKTHFAKLKEFCIKDRDIDRLLVSRRSTRAYDKRNLSDETVSELIETGRHAGSANNLQEESFLLVRNADTLKQLEEITINCLWNKGIKLFGKNRIMDMVLRKKFGPVLFRKYLRYNNIIKRRRKNNQTEGMIFRNAPVIIIVHGHAKNIMGPYNAAVALRNIELSALSKGIGSCWAGLFVGVAQTSRKLINPLLGINQNQTIYGAIMLGYSKYQTDFQIPRLKRELKVI